jgi:hypothetical protein
VENLREREEKECGARVCEAAWGFLYPWRVGGLHPACPSAGGGSDAPQSSTKLLRLEEDEGSKRYLDWAMEQGCWAGFGLRSGGLRPGKCFSYFFLLISFLLFTCFLF